MGYCSEGICADFFLVLLRDSWSQVSKAFAALEEKKRE